MLIRRLLAVLIGIAVAATVGLLALLLSPVAPVVSGLVFGLTALPFGAMLGWIVAVAPRTVPARRHSDDTVEVGWINAARAGSATDVVLLAGLALTFVSITRIELPTQLVLLGVLLVAFASAATRYAFLRHRAVRV